MNPLWAAWASTTAIAVMLTTPRAVTEGVSTWAGLAGPIRIGPTGSASARIFVNWYAILAASRSGMIEHVRLALQARFRQLTRSRIISDKRRIGLHFAIHFELRCALADQRQRIAHLARRTGVGRAEIGMRQQRHLRLDAEAAHVLGAGDRHLGDLLRVRVRPHMGVGEEVGALRA